MNLLNSFTMRRRDFFYFKLYANEEACRYGRFLPGLRTQTVTTFPCCQMTRELKNVALNECYKYRNVLLKLNLIFLL